MEAALAALLETELESRKKACEGLHRILDNVLRNHSEKDTKYRRVNISSKSFLENVISVPGGLDILFAVGFEEDPASNEHLIFPFGHSIEKMTWMRDQLASVARGNAPARTTTASSTFSQSINQPPKAVTCDTPSAKPAIARRLHGGRAKPSEHKIRFQQIITTHARDIMQYEDGSLQSKVHKVVPVSRLKTTALRLAEQSVEFLASAPAKKEAVISSCFLFVLLKWFKEEFFQWVNQPKCDACNGKTVPMRITTENQRLQHPTPEEAKYRAGHVEVYSCTACRNVVRFPRYNDPAKLLETRRGRCGEWANCFAAVCRAVGFEVRYVLDNADHVWTEVFSDLEGRWLHCDSCETALDTPLMYEAGWGKKLAYVLAFSCDEIVDVTWRYSMDYTATQARRKNFSEKWLRDWIRSMNTSIANRLREDQSGIVRRRRVHEVVEFMMPRTVNDNEKGGRISGSLTWRLSRGELGQGAAVAADQSFIITPTQSELDSKSLKLVYVSASDSYHRGGQVLQGFRACAFKCRNIARKVEQDWKMAYLAREPGTADAELSWKIQCPGTGMVQVSPSMDTESVPRSNKTDSQSMNQPQATVLTGLGCAAEFESGRVSVSVTADGETTSSIPDNFSLTFGAAGDNPPAQTVQITATLSGGKGSNSWQHSQLFRELLDSPGSNALEIEVDFN